VTCLWMALGPWPARGDQQGGLVRPAHRPRTAIHSP